jgi:maleamate amidohydrolase
MMPQWDDFLTATDRAVFARSGYGLRGGLGERPAVLVIDVTYDFCGDRPQPILESIKRWRSSCGDAAWAAFDPIRAVIDRAHDRGVPVVYTKSIDYRPDRFDAGRWADKNARTAEPADPLANEIVAPLAPEPRDLVIPKAKPSGFYGSLLGAHLTALGVDTVLVCGATTSGCVRATVVDAFSANFRVGVIAEGVFDRCQASHYMTLFDVQQKYADVLSAAEVLDYLQRLSRWQFADRMAALAPPGDRRGK